MAYALKGKPLSPRIQVEEEGEIHFAVSCRHCDNPVCVKSCITGALSVEDGVIHCDTNKCVGCYTCIMACPYGCIMPAASGVIQKCELCTNNAHQKPLCVQGCPNEAIVFEER